MRLLPLPLTLTLVTALAACSDNDASGIDQSDFESRVRSLAGADAENCGFVEVGDSTVDTNTCIADAFQAGRGAYGYYQRAGAGSVVLNALAADAEGAVSFVFFDSDPRVSDAADDGEIAVTACTDPTLTGSLDGDLFDVFACASSDTD